MQFYTVRYYKKINSGWLKGRVRNLTMFEALQYAPMVRDLFDTKMVRIEKQER